MLFPQPARGKAVTVGEAAEVAAHLESALLHTQQALFSLPMFKVEEFGTHLWSYPILAALGHISSLL